MAIRIIGIKPKLTPPPSDHVLAHLSIDSFKWINEQSQQSGISSRALMFDWIVNKKGRAYIKKDDKTIPVFGANTPTGQQYIRCVEEGNWTDELLTLEAFIN